MPEVREGQADQKLEEVVFAQFLAKGSTVTVRVPRSDTINLGVSKGLNEVIVACDEADQAKTQGLLARRGGREFRLYDGNVIPPKSSNPWGIPAQIVRAVMPAEFGNAEGVKALEKEILKEGVRLRGHAPKVRMFPKGILQELVKRT